MSSAVSDSSAPTHVKTPPHSIEAEQSVLGALMLDNRAWDKIAGQVCADDFYRQDYRFVFEAMEKLINTARPIDALTLAEYLRNNQQLELVGGETALYELANNTPTAANISAYADIVREKALLRHLIEVSTDITQTAYVPEGRDVKEIVDEAERRVLQIAETRQTGVGPQDISSLLAKASDRIDTLYHSDGALTGLETGFSDLDEMTSGLQDGELIIVAGRPSMGKTSFAMNIAEHAAMLTTQKEVKPVLVFSMEMPAESLAMRMMSSLGRIDQHRVRSGKLQDDDWPRLTSAVSILSNAKMFIDDTPAMSPGEVRSRARRLAREHDGIGLIVIDYLQLMQVPGFKDGRTGEVSEISRSLKALAKELNVPVVALSQLNRSLEQRQDRRPVMSDLRESGAIEQDADLIAFIYRDEVYHEDSADKGIAEVIIGKQRNGPIGKVRLTFLGQYTRFENYVPTYAVTENPFGDDA